MSVPTNRAGTGRHDRKLPDLLTVVQFHSDKYEGKKCKLISQRIFPQKGNSPVEFLSSPIRKVAKVKNLWSCVINSLHIPPGNYFLEVPLKDETRTVRQRVTVLRKFVAKDPKTRKIIGKPKTGVVSVEVLVGDGISLEETFLLLFATRYKFLTDVLLKENLTYAKPGNVDKPGFQTYLGVAKTAHEQVSSLLGYVALEFGFLETIKKLDDHFKVSNLVKLTSRNELHKAIAKLRDPFSNGKANVLGLAFLKDVELDELNKKKNPASTPLTKFEEKYFDEWKDKLEESRGFQSAKRYIDATGKLLSFAGNVVDTFEFIEAFYKAEKADDVFRTKLHAICEKRVRLEKTMSFQSHPVPADWFHRGDLTVIDTYKGTADETSAKAHWKGLQWTYSMAAQCIGLCEYGKLFKTVNVRGKQAGAAAVELYPIAKSLVGATDKMIGTNFITRAKEYIKQSALDLFAEAHNECMLQYAMFAVSYQHPKMEPYVQYLLRAKVLYGLKRLIDECGPDSGENTVTLRRPITMNYLSEVASLCRQRHAFKQAVEKQHIADYVQKLCLSKQFWVRRDHLLEDWIQHYFREEDATVRNEVLRFKDPKNSRTWFCVDFQRYWPIHFMESKSAFELATRLSVDFGLADEKHIEWCKLQYGKGRWEPAASGSKSKVLKILSWHDLTDGEAIDSETPVRAVLLLKETAPAKSNVPITFQVERTDGFNVPGPVYSTVIRRFTKMDKLRGLDKGDRFGAIAEFTYSYKWGKQPVKVYHGLKPMIETQKWVSVVKSVLSLGVFEQMRVAWKRKLHSKIAFPMSMAVKYQVGVDGGVTGYAEKKGILWDTTTEVTVTPTRQKSSPKGENAATFLARNIAKFTDLKFLERQCAKVAPPQPPMPKAKDIKVVLQAYTPDKMRWRDITKSYGLHTDHAMRVLFVLPKKYDRVPIGLRIDRSDTTPDVTGPHYTSNQVRRLDSSFGKHAGKWAVVIRPYYHYVWWDKAIESVPFGGAEGTYSVVKNYTPWYGIKLITEKRHSRLGITLDHYKDFGSGWYGMQCEIWWGVGTLDPNHMKEKAEPEDFPVWASKEQIELFWTGGGMLMVAKGDHVKVEGRSLDGATAKFVGMMTWDKKKKYHVNAQVIHDFANRSPGNKYVQYMY